MPLYFCVEYFWWPLPFKPLASHLRHTASTDNFLPSNNAKEAVSYSDLCLFSPHLLPRTERTKSKLGLTTEPADLPFPYGEEVVAVLLRMKTVVGPPDICKHVLQVTLRPHVMCALLHVLLASGHPAFGSPGGQGSAFPSCHAPSATHLTMPLCPSLDHHDGTCTSALSTSGGICH